MLVGGVILCFDLLPCSHTDNCETIYCNVEGLEFLSDSLLVAASDQMKDEGRQNFRCLSKDQSVHVFVVPPVPEPAAV